MEKVCFSFWRPNHRLIRRAQLALPPAYSPLFTHICFPASPVHLALNSPSSSEIKTRKHITDTVIHSSNSSTQEAEAVRPLHSKTLSQIEKKRKIRLLIIQIQDQVTQEAKGRDLLSPGVLGQPMQYRKGSLENRSLEPW